LSIIMNVYTLLLKTLNHVTTLTFSTLIFLNKNPLTFVLNGISTSSLNTLKMKFFTNFFKNFLTWNYLVGGYDFKTTPLLTLNSDLPTQSNSLTNLQTKVPNLINRNTLTYTVNPLKFWRLYTTHFFSEFYTRLQLLTYKSFSFSWYYLSGFVFILFIDACLTDDEPLWEPIEWSLVQTWILFIFSFAWIAENLIVSRYGSYAGRDKRVWMAWYKTFWLIEGYYVLNYGVAVVLVMVPFYFELNYNLSFIYSWWTWFSKVFFLNLHYYILWYFLSLYGSKLMLDGLVLKKYFY